MNKFCVAVLVLPFVLTQILDKPALKHYKVLHSKLLVHQASAQEETLWAKANYYGNIIKESLDLDDDHKKKFGNITEVCFSKDWSAGIRQLMVEIINMLTEFTDVIIRAERDEISGEKVEKPIRLKHLISFVDRIKQQEKSLTDQSEFERFYKNCNLRGVGIQQIMDAVKELQYDMENSHSQIHY